MWVKHDRSNEHNKKNSELLKNSPGPLAENFPPRCPKFICQPKLFLNKLLYEDSVCEMP